MEKWRAIWNSSERINNTILEILIKADGFDSGPGSFSLENWKIYVQEFFNKLSIQSNESIFELSDLTDCIRSLIS